MPTYDEVEIIDASAGKSVTGTGKPSDPFELSGDVTTPGSNMAYKTDGSGTRGWYADTAIMDPDQFEEHLDEAFSGTDISVSGSDLPTNTAAIWVFINGVAAIPGTGSAVYDKFQRIDASTIRLNNSQTSSVIYVKWLPSA